MNLLKTNTRAGRQEADETTQSSYSLLPKDIAEDFYKKYQEDDFVPVKGSCNPRNLFDDSDTEDEYWFNIVKKYLRMYKF